MNYAIVDQDKDSITIKFPKKIRENYQGIQFSDDIDVDFRELEGYEVSPQIEYLASKALSSDFVWFTKVL